MGYYNTFGAPEQKFVALAPEAGSGLTVTEGHLIEGYASLFGKRDQGNDVVERGAYGASLARLAAAREICIAFGVPPMLIGIPGDATYANYQEANRAFYRLTVLPLVAKVTAAVSHWLEGFTGEAAELKPDLDQVPALAVERDQQWARVGAASFLSKAEKRALLGLPPLAEDE